METGEGKRERERERERERGRRGNEAEITLMRTASRKVKVGPTRGCSVNTCPVGELESILLG